MCERAEDTLCPTRGFSEKNCKTFVAAFNFADQFWLEVLTMYWNITSPTTFCFRFFVGEWTSEFQYRFQVFFGVWTGISLYLLLSGGHCWNTRSLMAW